MAMFPSADERINYIEDAEFKLLSDAQRSAAIKLVEFAYRDGFAAALAIVLQYHETRRAELWATATENGIAGAHAAAHGESIGAISALHLPGDEPQDVSARVPPPKDGTEISIRLNGWVPAYWDDELKTFVLSRPLHMESISEPEAWRPRKQITARALPPSGKE